VALLGAVTAAGRLFEVDVRLRPDGAKGLLVSSLASFGDYQRERAWTWEHQALVRARFVAGDPILHADFERVRAETLAHARDPARVREDVVAMRRRMRAELDRSDAAVFDLKQGEGGLVDLEFVLQALVLVHAQSRRELLAPRNTPGLVDAMHAAGLFDVATTAALLEAHAPCCRGDWSARWIAVRGACHSMPDSKPRVQAVRTAARANGLAFE
jgi:glutamate-ammonia-ligase adenylyltransferase